MFTALSRLSRVVPSEKLKPGNQDDFREVYLRKSCQAGSTTALLSASGFASSHGLLYEACSHGINVTSRSTLAGPAAAAGNTIGARLIKMNDSHHKAAELHRLASHAHDAAMERHGKGEHQSGHELSRKALEHSERAFELAKAAHRESEEELRK